MSANSKKTGIAVFKIWIIIVDNDFLTVQGAECNGPTNTCISKDRIGKQRPRPRIRGDATKREKKHFHRQPRRDPPSDKTWEAI